MESLEYIEHSKAKLQDLTGRYQFVLATMLATLAFALYGTYILYYQNSILEAAKAGDASSASEFDKLDGFNLLKIVNMLCGITNIVAVCMFLYAASLNVFQYYSGAVAHTPGMTVGWLFIPVVHIFMGFKSLVELSRTSNAMVSGKSATEVPHAKPHSSAVLWGVLWILQTLGTYIVIAWTVSMFAEMRETPPDELKIVQFEKMYYYGLISSVASILSGIFLLMFFSKVNKEQNQFRTS